MWRILRIKQGSQFFVSDIEYPTTSVPFRRGTKGLFSEANNNHLRTILQHCNLVRDLDKQVEDNQKKKKGKALQDCAIDFEEEEDEEEEPEPPTKKCKTQNIFGDCLDEVEPEEDTVEWEDHPAEKQPKRQKKKSKRVKRHLFSY